MAMAARLVSVGSMDLNVTGSPSSAGRPQPEAISSKTTTAKFDKCRKSIRMFGFFMVCSSFFLGVRRSTPPPCCGEAWLRRGRREHGSRTPKGGVATAKQRIIFLFISAFQIFIPSSICCSVSLNPQRRITFCIAMLVADVSTQTVSTFSPARRAMAALIIRTANPRLLNSGWT